MVKRFTLDLCAFAMGTILTLGKAPDISRMNKAVQQMVQEAVKANDVAGQSAYQCDFSHYLNICLVYH